MGVTFDEDTAEGFFLKHSVISDGAFRELFAGLVLSGNPIIADGGDAPMHDFFPFLTHLGLQACSLTKAALDAAVGRIRDESAIAMQLLPPHAWANKEPE